MHRLVESVRSMAGVSLPLSAMMAAAAIAGGLLAARPSNDRREFEMWVFAREHAMAYESLLEQYKVNHGIEVGLTRISIDALLQRVRSGLFSGTPMADLFEIEYVSAGQLFRGPADKVGLVPLDDRLRDANLLDQINGPSLAAWQHSGVQLGLPHDVHPVGLIVRHDLISHYGLSLDNVETWTDFFQALRPLLDIDQDEDGRPDHYLLSYWPSHAGYTELLLRQAGGRLFDHRGLPVLHEGPNPRVLATAVSWCIGPNRVATEIPDFSDTGNRRKARGDAIAYLAPDWMTGVWKNDVPDAAGRVRLIALPAWEPGGRRTSVYGGTMLAIPTSSERIDQAWELAVELYFSPEPAKVTWEQAGVISPVRSLWSSSFYHQPDEYYGGQPIGSLLIKLAPDVPHRANSPYLRAAQSELQAVGMRLLEHAEQTQTYDPALLEPIAREYLERSSEKLARVIERSPFIGGRQR